MGPLSRGCATEPSGLTGGAQPCQAPGLWAAPALSGCRAALVPLVPLGDPLGRQGELPSEGPSAGESPVDGQHPLPLQVPGCSPTRQGCRSWQTSSRWGPPPRGCGTSFPFPVEAGGASFCRAAVDSRRGEGRGSPSTRFKSALQGWFPLAPAPPQALRAGPGGGGARRGRGA